MMEENALRDSEISVNTPETPETPTQTPLVWYNAMYNTPPFQPFHPIMTPALYVPNPNYTSSRTKEEEKTEKLRLTINEKVNKVLNLLKSFKWSISDFLHYTFAMEDSNKKSFIPMNTHIRWPQSFLQVKQISG